MVQRNILVIGSLNMDQVVRVSRIPVLGETLLSASSIQLIPGGKGANQAVAIARLGAAVAMAGRVGSDPFGERLLQALKADHVDTNLLLVDPLEASGAAFIFLTTDGDNAIVVASGANMRVGADATQNANIAKAMKQAQAVVLQLEIPLETVRSVTALAYQAGVPVILNLAPAQPLPEDMLHQLHVLVVNENEASLLSGQHVASLEDARVVGTVLHRSGITNVVITLGAQGAILITADHHGKARIIHQSAPSVQVVDTTAAGDCFVGALTVALMEGQTAEDALRFAVFASALKVTRLGAQSGLPTRAEVNALLSSEEAKRGNDATNHP